MSRLKEPQFFAADVLGHQRNVAQWEDYQRCFAGIGHESIIGEASTAYMLSRTAAADIHRFTPLARILVMLRNPIDVMYELHNKRVFMGMEHLTNFATAISSDEPRTWRAGRWQSEKVIRAPYREVVDFAPQLERYLATFGRDRVHAEIYDDLVVDPRKVCDRVLGFLGLSPDGLIAFPTENTARLSRSHELQDWLREPPSRLRRLARSVIPAEARKHLGTKLRRLNERPAAVPMDPTLRRKLQDEYGSAIERLGVLIGRNLSCWTT